MPLRMPLKKALKGVFSKGGMDLKGMLSKSTIGQAYQKCLPCTIVFSMDFNGASWVFPVDMGVHIL